jgi:hypothetical protein
MLVDAHESVVRDHARFSRGATQALRRLATGALRRLGAGHVEDEARDRDRGDTCSASSN